MGAATAIMYGATDPTIGGMVLDSPFTSLPKLALELVHSNEVRNNYFFYTNIYLQSIVIIK